MENLEKEVALLKEKLELLERIRELEKPQITVTPQPYPVYIYPYYVYPFQVYPPSMPVYTPAEIPYITTIPWETITITWGNVPGDAYLQ